MSEKVLITARSLYDVMAGAREKLTDAGYEIVTPRPGQTLTPDQFKELVKDAVAIILGLEECTAEIIQAGRKLKVISRFGVGMDNVDIPAATARGIPVTGTPGANNVSVAELTMGFILALARRIPQHDREVRAGEWERFTGTEVSGATLGIVGLGAVGRDVARRALCFGMEVLYYDPAPPPAEFLSQTPVTAVPLEKLLATSDFVTLHLPLTPETHHLIDDRALRLMKPTAYLINTARGGIVDEQALYDALSNGRLAGAAFDAFAQEPPIASPLLGLDNFIASPHAGAATAQAIHRMGAMAVENVLSVLRGERPAGLVNPDVYGA